MRRAIALAQETKHRSRTSRTGCVIVLDGRIIGEAHDEVKLRHDPSAHAEIVAICQARESLGCDDLREATLYSTLQPCSMA